MTTTAAEDGKELPKSVGGGRPSSEAAAGRLAAATTTYLSLGSAVVKGGGSVEDEGSCLWSGFDDSLTYFLCPPSPDRGADSVLWCW